MPAESSSEDGDEGRVELEMGLERLRLMILAEGEEREIRRIWDALKKDKVADGSLRTKLEEVRMHVDNLPPAPEQALPTPSIQIQTS